MTGKCFLFLLAVFFSTPYSKAESSCEKSPGALVIAHGSHHHHGPHGFIFNAEKDLWNDTVIETVEAAKKRLEMPVELAFGMWDKDSFEDGVNRLALQGVCELRIIPLFISSKSEVIDIQKYMFGINEKNEFPIHVDKVVIPQQIKKIKFGKALNDDKSVGEIIFERLSEISITPRSEGVIFIAHGPYGDDYEASWIELLKLHGDRVQKSFNQLHAEPFYEFSYFTLRDDSPEPTRSNRTQQIRNKVQELNNKSITPIISPVLLTEGGIEAALRERLQGLNYKIQNKFILPHSKMVDWIIYQAQNL
ncbi:MAG: sirohydrochlorin chelatase [Pseudobdellovibrionaceae bacterium]